MRDRWEWYERQIEMAGKMVKLVSEMMKKTGKMKNTEIKFAE